MVRKRTVCLVLVSALLLFSSYTQSVKPRIAIVPFTAINTAKSEAQVLTVLVETALVKTGGFTVIEQNQVETILDAQEFSIADCTDEKCAIEFGKLLAAEQIVLGSLSSLGGKYILTAKIIDVQRGTNILAERTEAANAKDLPQAADTLAYALAGLTVRVGSSPAIATKFAELLIQTDREGAEIRVNGIKKGVSPLLVEKIPLGHVTIEARNGNYYARKDLELTAEGLQKLGLTLQQSTGNLYIRSPITKGFSVYLSGQKLGEFTDGLYEGLPVGEYALELTGSGYYWSGQVTVQAGKTMTVQATLTEIGSISYTIQDGAVAELDLQTEKKKLTGSGLLEHIPIGTYSFSVTGDEYTPIEGSFSIRRGEDFDFHPRLSISPEVLMRREQIALTAELDRLKAYIDPSAKITDQAIAEGEALLYRLRQSEFSFPELKEQAESILNAMVAAKHKADLMEALDSARSRRQKLVSQEGSLKDLKAGFSTAGWISFGVGVLSFIGTGVSWALASNAYSKYSESRLSADTQKYKDQVKQYADLMLYGSIAGGAGISLGGVFSLLQPDMAQHRKSILDLDIEILRLEGELK